MSKNSRVLGAAVTVRPDIGTGETPPWWLGTGRLKQSTTYMMADTLPLFCNNKPTPTYAPTKVLTSTNANLRIVKVERKRSD